MILDTGKVRCWGATGIGRLGYGNRNNIGDGERHGRSGRLSAQAGGRWRSASGAAFTPARSSTTARCAAGANGGVSSATGTRPEIGDTELASFGGHGQPRSGPKGAVAISGGFDHTCALLDNNAVRCWGANADGQLGYANTTVIGDDETPATAGPTSLGGVFFATADLSLTASAAPASITTGGAVTYTITLTNAGPDAAQPAVQRAHRASGRPIRATPPRAAPTTVPPAAWTPASVPSGRERDAHADPSHGRARGPALGDR